jgi:hypothetical protein
VSYCFGYLKAFGSKWDGVSGEYYRIRSSSICTGHLVLSVITQVVKDGIDIYSSNRRMQEELRWGSIIKRTNLEEEMEGEMMINHFYLIENTLHLH